MTALRVAFVCQWFRPEPVSQPGWIVDALRRRGADVEVLTGIPNYPNGRVLPGYRASQVTSEVLDGVAVHRTPLFPSHDGSASKRILNYVSWALSGAMWGRRHLKKADVALVYSSPATAALPAMVARFLHGVPYVLLVQDVWPDSIFSSGFLQGPVSGIAERLTSIFVAAAYRHASHIAVISPGMADLLASRGVAREKLSVVYNWVNEATDEVAVLRLREELELSPEAFLVMYAGNQGAAQGLGSVIQAFATIPAYEDCHLVLVGDGVEGNSLKALAARDCPSRVHFVDPQPRESMPGVMTQADVQLVSLSDRELFAVTMPSKLQSVMAAGHPVILCGRGDAATVVTEAAAGLAVPPEDSAALASAVRDLRNAPAADRQRMARNGEAYYQLHMAERVGARRLMAALEGAVQRAITSDPLGTSGNWEGNQLQ
jgi:glycosyltransferase involved in cell wall biosynthesis